MNDLDRLTYLPRYYYELQSVRFAPVWVAFLGFFLVRKALASRWVWIGPAGAWALVLGLLAVQVLWYWLANRYCESRFGWLKPSRLRFVKKKKGPLFFIVWLVFLAWALYCRANHSAAFFPYLVALFMSQPAQDAENPRIRRIYFGLGAGLIAVSALLNRFAHLDGTIFIVTLCAVMLGLGFADLLLLTRLCPPLHEQADA